MIASCRRDHPGRRAHREHRRWRTRLPCLPSPGSRTRPARCDLTLPKIAPDAAARCDFMRRR